MIRNEFQKDIKSDLLQLQKRFTFNFRYDNYSEKFIFTIDKNMITHSFNRSILTLMDIYDYDYSIVKE